MTTQDTPAFDLVGGVDLAVVSGLVTSFYETNRSLFTQTLNVNQLGVTDIKIDCANAPTISSSPPPGARSGKMFAKERRALNDLVPADQVESKLDEFIATIPVAYITFDNVSITFEGKYPYSCVTQITGRMGFGGVYVVFSLSSPEFDSDLPIFDRFAISQAWELIQTLGITFLPPSIPGFNWGGMKAATESTGNDEYFLTYTGLGPVVLPDPGTAWPGDCFFMGIDTPVINLVLERAIQPHGWSNSGSKGPVDWQYSCLASFASVQVVPPGAGVDLEVTFDVKGDASLSISDMNIGCTGTLSGSITANLRFGVSQQGANQVFNVSVASISTDLSLDLSDVPGWMSDAFNAAVDPILNDIGGVAASHFNGTSYTLFTLQPTPFNLPGLPAMNFVMQNVTTGSFSGPNGVPLLMLTGIPAMMPAPSVEMKKSWTINGKTSTSALKAGV